MAWEGAQEDTAGLGSQRGRGREVRGEGLPALVGADGHVRGVGQPLGSGRLMDGPSGKV